MKFIAFYGWHDASVAGFDGSEIKYMKIERITGIKHDSFFDGWPPSKPVGSDERLKTETAIKFIKLACEKWNFEPDAIAFCGFGYCKNEFTLWEERPRIYGFNVPTFCLDHHYAHALSVWPVCDSDISKSIIVDGVGDYSKTHKVIQHPNDIYKAKVLYQTSQPSLSSMLIEAGYKLGLKGARIDFAGKVMGAQSYGHPSDLNYNDYDIDDINLTEIVKNSNLTSYFGEPEFNNWLATMHKIGIYTIINLFKRYCLLNERISYTGGCAQNSVLNEMLYQYYGDNLFIPPHCYDGGLTLGCIEFLRIYYGQDKFSNINFPFWQEDDLKEIPSEETIDEVVDMLIQKKIVGWFQGRGEIGPRALGNRSILMSPILENGKDIINNKVKKREFWRPYAASVLEEECKKWFHCNSSKFMLRAVKVRDDKIHKIPSVSHIDNTSRIQTVSSESNKLFYNLIDKFNKKTGIPMLLNTSLNTAGQPIFSNKDQCVNMINETEIDVICHGNTLIKKIKLA